MMFLPGSKGFFRTGPAVLLLALIASVYYLSRVAHLAPERMPSESFFVGTLLANACAALFLSGALGRQVGGFFDMMSKGSGAPALDRIFNQRGNLAIAAALTLVIAGYVAKMDPWAAPAYGLPGLNWPLAIMLMLVNFPIGLSVGALMHYWWEAYRAWQEEKITAFPLPRSKLARYSMINTTITVTAAVIACATFLGLRVSVMEPDMAIIAFSIITLILVGATYVVPLYGLSTRLHLAKHDLLGQVETDLARCFETVRTGPPEETEAAQARVDALIAYRDTLRGLSVFPPNGEYSITTAAGVVVLSLLPALIDYILP